MSTFSEVDDYWNSSQTKAFNFDEVTHNVSDISFFTSVENVSKSKTESKFCITGTAISHSVCLLPINNIIKEKNLKKYLSDENTKNVEKRQTEDIVNIIITEGDFNSLCYRSIKSKTDLLAKTIEVKDGNCILTAVLLLSDTVKWSLLCDILKSNIIAFQHYTEYLTVTLNANKLLDLMEIKNHNIILGFKLYKVLFKHFSRRENIKGVKKKMQTIFNYCLGNMSSDENDTHIITKYLNLIDWQIERQSFEDFNVVNFSVNYCLRIYCQKFWNATEEQLCNPYVLGKHHNMSSRQLQWMLLDAYIFTKSWNDIVKMFTKSNWFGSKKVINSLICGENIARHLYDNSAPSTILEIFLSMIVNIEKSVTLGIKFKCHRHVINFYIQEKNKISLEAYKMKLDKQSEDYFYIEEVLHAKNQKWKN